MTVCEKCNKVEAIEELMLENGLHLEVCEECSNQIFYSMVRKGVDRFIPWAEQNYTNAKDLAYQLYDFEEVSEYFNGDNENAEYITMFTYGILKYPHNIKREGGIDIVEHSTVSGHTMFSTGSFPITRITGNDKDKVQGTLFKVPSHVVLHNYDFVEGYNPRRPKRQNMYNREVVKVTTPNGEVIEANMYIANPSYFSDWYAPEYHIPTGNFDDLKKYVKARRRRY